MFESSANKLVKKAITLDDILLKLRGLRHYFTPGYQPLIDFSDPAAEYYSQFMTIPLKDLHKLVFKLVIAKESGNPEAYRRAHDELMKFVLSHPLLRNIERHPGKVLPAIKLLSPVLERPGRLFEYHPFETLKRLDEIILKTIEKSPIAAGYMMRGARVGEKGPIGGDILSTAADAAIPAGGLIMLYGLLKKLLSKRRAKKVKLDDGTTIYLKQKSDTRLTPYILGGLLTMALPHLLDIGYAYALGRWNVERARKIKNLLDLAQGK